MKNRTRGRKAYGSVMDVPIENFSNPPKSLSVDGRPVQNNAWTSLESVNAFHEVLRAYDKDYDPNIRTMSQLSRMNNLKRLLESNHVQ